MEKKKIEEIFVKSYRIRFVKNRNKCEIEIYKGQIMYKKKIEYVKIENYKIMMGSGE